MKLIKGLDLTGLIIGACSKRIVLPPRCETEKEVKSVVTSPETQTAATDIPSQVERDIGQGPEWDMWKVDIGIK